MKKSKYTETVCIFPGDPASQLGTGVLLTYRSGAGSEMPLHSVIDGGRPTFTDSVGHHVRVSDTSAYHCSLSLCFPSFCNERCMKIPGIP